MEINKEKLPKHIAIIMDGNGRWAKSKGYPRAYGHREGVKTIRKILKEAQRIGIKYLTVYAFSTENWKRSEKEVKALMLLFKEFLKKERKELDGNNVKLVFSGTDEGVSEKLLDLMKETSDFLSKNTGITLNIAFNYGGRKEIIDGINKLLKEGKKEISIDDFQNYLYQSEIPDPELVIRTSGEFRISNFLLWEIAYSEFIITEKYWPEFDEEDLKKAIVDYTNRDRRFGGVKE